VVLEPKRKNLRKKRRAVHSPAKWRCLLLQRVLCTAPLVYTLVVAAAGNENYDQNNPNAAVVVTETAE